MSPSPKIDKAKCTLCGTCVQVCPMEVFKKEGEDIKIAKDKCIGCKACELQCEKAAIKVDDE